LESLGYVSQRTTYTEHFWQEYVATCRALAKQSQVSMRDLDRALWSWPGLPDRDRYRLPPPRHSSRRGREAHRDGDPLQSGSTLGRGSSLTPRERLARRV
jgi:hypothetical protein